MAGEGGGPGDPGLVPAAPASARGGEPPEVDDLVSAAGDAILDVRVSFGERTLVADPDRVVDVMRAARECGFALFLGVTASDHPTLPERHCLAYHLLDLSRPRRVRVQAWAAEGQAVPSVTSVYPAANWHEREVYDMFGVTFAGHPNLVRILMSDDWEGHPMRKDHPVGGEEVRFSQDV